MRRTVLSLLLAYFALFVSPPAATSADAGGRPRIGLVLSGGGARGAAHVGVLRVLEELRVPVDVIAGTSMGSIVGGLYASGMTPDEIEANLTRVDWNEAMTDSTARELVAYRRTRQDEALAAQVRVGLRDGRIMLPLGILQGQKLEMILREMTLPVAAVHDFDRLPIPFRAVAADLETGEAVVLAADDLARAMRASMSVPAVFSPVEMDGRLLVDGGVVDNLPVDAARAMGAELIIAVDISTALAPRARITSATGVNSQVATMQTRGGTQAEIRQLGARDILIVPDLGDITFSDFARAAEAIPRGEAGARAAEARLRELALPAEAWTAYRAAVPRPSRDLPVVREIRLRQDTPLADAFILERLTVRLGEPLDLGALRSDLQGLYGLDLFEKIGYDLEPVEEGAALVLDCRRKEWGPDYIQFGLTLQGDFEGENFYNFSFRLNRLAVNARGGEWLTDLRLGENMSFSTEFYQPFRGPGGFFIAPRAYYRRDPVDIYITGAPPLAWDLSIAGGALDVGRALGNWGEVRLGVAREKQKADFSYGLLGRYELNYDDGRVYLRLGADTMDRAVFPTRGLEAEMVVARSLEALGAGQETDQARLRLNGVRTWGRLTGAAGLELGGVTEEVGLPSLFQLGGLGRLSGYGMERTFGFYEGLARLGTQVRIADIHAGPYDMPVYAGMTLEAGQVWARESAIGWDSVELHGSVYLGLDSLAGPILFAYGRGDGGQDAYYFMLGWPFE
jgi:NTE family protein